MKKLFALLLMLASTPALAHFELGFYDGKDLAGQACSVELTGVTFEGGVRSPLNERVAVKFEGKEWSLSHPPVVDLQAQELGFENTQLRSARGVKGGGEALVLKMSHEEGHEGPSEVSYLSNIMVSGAMTKAFSQCVDLKHRER